MLQNLPFVAFALANRSDAVIMTPALLNEAYRGVRLDLDIKSVIGTSPTLDLKLRAIMPNGVKVDIPSATFAQKTAAGQDALSLYPGLSTLYNVALVLPHAWEVYGAIGGTAAARASTRLTGSVGGATALKIFHLGLNTNPYKYTFVTALTEKKAANTLTSNGTAPTAGKHVTLNTTIYTWKATNLTEVKSSGTITDGNSVNFADGDTITIGKWGSQKVYKFKTDLTIPNEIPNEIKIGATADDSLLNLSKAIRAATGGGTAYSSNTTVHPTVTCSASVSNHAITVTAKTVGEQGNLNLLKTTAGPTRVTLSGANLTGGVDAVPYEVLIGASASAALDNLKSAVNGTTGEGTVYGTGTVAHPTIDASTKDATTLLFVAKVVGIVPNTYPTTEDDTTTSFPEVTLGGSLATVPGVDSIANEVIKGSTIDEMVQNMIDAIAPSSSTLGVTVSTATVENDLVEPVDGTITSHHTDFQAKAGVLAAAANALVSTTDEANVGFTGATLAGGIDQAAFNFAMFGELLP